MVMVESGAKVAKSRSPRDLTQENLEGANLIKANLEGARLTGASPTFCHVSFLCALSLSMCFFDGNNGAIIGFTSFSLIWSENTTHTARRNH